MDSLLETRDLAIGVNGFAVAEKIDLTVGSGQLVALIEPDDAGRSMLIDTVVGRIAPLCGEVIVLGAPPSMRRPRLAALRGLGHVKIGGPGPIGTARRQLRIAVDRDETLRSLLEEIPRLADVVRHRILYVDTGVARALDVAVALASRPRLLLVDELSVSSQPTDSAMMHRLLRLAADRLDSGVVIVGRSTTALESVADLCGTIGHGVSVRALSAAS